MVKEVEIFDPILEHLSHDNEANIVAESNSAGSNIDDVASVTTHADKRNINLHMLPIQCNYTSENNDTNVQNNKESK